MNKLEQLKKMTTVVADTGDIELIKQYSPQDATTNPSLILKAAQQHQYQPLLREAIEWAKGRAPSTEQRLKQVIHKLSVNFGVEILKYIPGRVSTEVDAHLSFDTEATIKEALQLIGLYREAGVESQRILIKIAATYEGIHAAQELEQQGIHCNLTLMFNFVQALACAQAGVTLISPFVGRIYDWYKKQEAREFTPQEDPGVLSVTKIYHYYRKFDIPTVVMGASFRHIGQIEALAGCDYLTISPQLLAELQQQEAPLQQKLASPHAKTLPLTQLTIDETSFRWQMNEDAMATEKLAEGIRLFSRDHEKLQQLLNQF